MSLKRNLTAFSPNGEYLAYSSPDGCLKIWESSTGLLKQDYTPSSHLSATCSSLTWGPSPSIQHVSKKLKKIKSGDLLNLRLIAMGTMTGDILLYSFSNADLHTILNNGHTGRVNDVVCHSNTLYSCSNDHHIIIWDISSSKIKTKWKANTGTVYSLCVIDKNNLLSASNSIQWWDVKRKTVKKVFNGHGTEIFRLMPITLNDSRYVLSAAVGDRVINAWPLNEKSKAHTVTSFVLLDEPTSIDILVKEENESLQMSAVSQDGTFHFFEHEMVGKSKKPVQPKFTVQIALKSSGDEKSGCLPILAANISDGLDVCLISYGSFLKPAFERIDISNVSSNLFLVRNVSVFSSTLEESITKVKQTEKPNDVKMLAPGHMIDINFSEKSLKKRKKKFVDIKELPMEERLKALDLSKAPKDSTEEDPAVKSDSMVHLLLQGLQSNDNNMLASVLTNTDESVIHNTIKRLPIQSIFPLLKVLHNRMSKKENRTHSALKWFTVLLTIHLPYFMSCPDIHTYLIPFTQLIAAKKEVACKLLQAHGILKMLMIQAANYTTEMIETSSKPLLEYASESSSESEDELSQSDAEFDHESVEMSSSASSESSDTDESDMED